MLLMPLLIEQLNTGKKFMHLIKTMDRTNNSFYRLIGPIFGSRQVAKEVGINVYDDDDKEWIVALKDGRLIGLLSIKGRLVSDCYVIPSERNNGVFDDLLKYALSIYGGNLRANCTKASVRAFEKAGFKPTKKTKNFQMMEQNHA